MKKILFLIFFSVSIVFAQDSTKYIQDSTMQTQIFSRHDGNWWKKVGSLDQIPYLIGLFDGLSLGATIVINDFRQNDICYQTGANAADDFFVRLDTIKAGNMYEELDIFYNDTLNTKVLFENAFRYIVFKLSAHEPSNLNKLLEAYRKEEENK